MTVVRWRGARVLLRAHGWPACWHASRACWWRSALANKMARSVWAMLTKQEDYRDPMAAAAARNLHIVWINRIEFLRTEPIIDANKARYHETGNEAD